MANAKEWAASLTDEEIAHLLTERRAYQTATSILALRGEEQRRKQPK